MASYSSLKVAELREELKRRGISAPGTKSEMIEKLKADDAKKAEESAKAEVVEQPAEPVVPVPAPVAEATQPSEPVADVPEAKQPEGLEAAITAASEGATTAPETSSTEPIPTEPTEASAASTEDYSAKLDALKTKVLGELERRLERNQKFGGDADKEKDIQTQITRIKKFGLNSISQGEAILGVKPKQKPNGGRQNDGRRNSNSNRGRSNNNRVNKENNGRRRPTS